MHSHSVRKVLIYRIGSLGDTLVALPCFHLIARTYPNAERILLTNFPVHVKAPAAAAVLEGSKLVHGYMRYEIGTRDPRKLWRIAREIRRFKPDLMVYLMPARSQRAVWRDKHYFRLAAGVKHIIGLPKKAELPRTRNPATGLYEAEALRLGKTLADLGDAAVDDPIHWELRLTQKERDAARQALGTLASEQLIACGPGTKMQAKDWGQENWRELLATLSLRYPTSGLVLVGAQEDFAVSDYVARDWHGPAINLCGRLSPRETAAVLGFASVFLGPDSGPMHLAACVGTPCVIAFSARGLPGVWYPVGRDHQILYRQVSCYGCNLETCITNGRRCLASITVEQMAEAVHVALFARTSRHDSGSKV